MNVDEAKACYRLLEDAEYHIIDADLPDIEADLHILKEKLEKIIWGPK